MRRFSMLIFAAAVAGVVLTGFGAAPSSAVAPPGGIFRIVFAPPEQLDTMDPARANPQASWSLLDLTCARLMSYPDRAGARAYSLVPEVAAAPPKTSKDGKTYT